MKLYGAEVAKKVRYRFRRAYIETLPQEDFDVFLTLPPEWLQLVKEVKIHSRVTDKHGDAFEKRARTH